MKYFSTRGGKSATFEETLFSGYAPDGGLYMPETIPKLNANTLDNWKQLKLTYTQVVEKIVRLFVSEEEIPVKDLDNAIKNAYAKFSVPEIIGFKELNGASGKSFTLAQMYHGKTASFKDYSLALIGQFIEIFSQKRRTRTVILVGTSGDTGSAAMESVKGLSAVDIIVLYPKNNVSMVQEMQMQSYLDDNMHVYAVDGSSDELDVPIKRCFPRDNVTSVNSVSWTRIMIQIAHYVYFFLREGEEIDVFVPTGAAGNITAGIIACLMGVPINLFCATNVNDNVEKFLSSGIYEMGGSVVPTPASAMDIRFPYNVERIAFLFLDAPATVKLVETDKGDIATETREKISQYVKGTFKTETSLIYETIKQCWNQNNFMICPHTATAVAYFNEYSVGSPLKKAYIIATASPLKFPESSEEAGISSDEWNGYKLSDTLQGVLKVPKIMARNEDCIKKWHQMLEENINEILNKSIE